MMNKPAYNVTIKTYGQKVWLTWENYACGKHERRFDTEAGARQWLTDNGWIVKS